jgi:hypothetical protein
MKRIRSRYFFELAPPLARSYLASFQVLSAAFIAPNFTG